MKKKTLVILLSLAMVLSLFPVSAFASDTTSDFSDMPSNWSTKALENAVNNGLLVGDNGKIMPNDNLTRAQMATVVNRAFGTTEKVSLSNYTDVAANAWYYDDMAKAVQMETFVGSGDKLNPDNNITREEAFVVLARAFKLSGAAESALDKFSDKASVSSWAKDDVSSLVAVGYVLGSNGQLNPKQNITRAEFAQMMDNLLKNYIKTAGTYTTDYTGNVMINVPGVTLKDIKITGDLIIGDGVGNGDVILDGVTVTGRTIIRGSGDIKNGIPAEITPLTSKELNYFNGNEFFNGETMNIHNQFLSSLYDAPEKIDLFQLFYCGSGQSEPPTEAEEAAVIAYNGWEAAPDCPCEKISRANMDAVLTKYMGLTLADTGEIGLEKFTYLKEYDAYYYYHGDTNYRGNITFSSGEREGDIIRLFYNDTFMADGDKVLTLREKDGGYLFVSNQKA